MKKIPKPELKSATVMSAFDMNKVPFSKTRTILTPEQLDKIASGQSMSDESTGTSSLSDHIPKLGGSDPIPKRSSSTSDTVTRAGASDTVATLGNSSSTEIKK